MLLDLVRVFADQQSVELTDHCCHRLRTDRRFSPSDDDLVGFDLHEHVVARNTTDACGCDNGLDGCDLQRIPYLIFFA